MLASAHSIVRYANGQAYPDKLTRKTHAHYLAYAERVLEAYRLGVGRPRRELHKAVEAVFGEEPDCDKRRIAALCKLLDDAGEFDRDERGQAAALRLKVFAAAAALHPLVTAPDGIFERSELEAKSGIATTLGMTWAEIDAKLYVDVIDRQPLLSFNGFESAEALLSRYNLAQVQACLYKARQVVVLAKSDFATIVRSAKLARLLVETSRVAEGQYRIALSGPSSVLHETRRYGVNFARFVSSLVACRDWELSADLGTPWGRTVRLRLTSESGYRSHVATPAVFDSDVEAELAAAWGEARDGWRLMRDAGILQSGQLTFVPDFLLRHDDGREVFVEVVGFWTPEYLDAKRKTLARFADRRILLIVPRRKAKADVDAVGLVTYGNRIKPERVVESAEKMTAAEPGKRV